MPAIRLPLFSILLIGLIGPSVVAAQPAGDDAAPSADRAASDREMPDGDVSETMPSGEPSNERATEAETAVPTGDAGPPMRPPVPGDASRVGEVGPPVYWLRDEDGELHAVPGMTMADFWRAYELIHRLDAPVKPPAVVIRQLFIEAKLAAPATTIGTAEAMRLTAHVGMHVNRTGWVRVPLGFAGAVYSGDARLIDSDAAHYVAFEGDVGGYVLWVDVVEPGAHRLVLPLQIRAEETGSGGRCELSLPLVAESELRLTVPDDDLSVTVTGAAVELPPGDVESSDQNEESTDDENASPDTEDTSPGDDNGRPAFVYRGLGRELEIRWRRHDPAQEQTPTALEALDGTVLVSIDGQTITTEALLRVRSLGGPLERLYVRLPDRAELIPRPQPGYRVAIVIDRSLLPADVLPEDSARQPAASPGASYAEVTLERPTTEPIEIRLFTQRRHRVDDSTGGDAGGPSPVGPVPPAGGVTSSPAAVDLGGFEVLGALRQSGYVAVGVVGDWQVNWSPPRGVRQVSAVPAVLHRGEFVAGFEYVSQPFSLPLRLTARRSRIGVEPRYVVRVEPDGVYLESRLDYAIRSANAFGVSIDMTGWTVDEIGPANVVDLDGVDTEATSPLFVPFLQSVLGEVKIVVRARRELDDPLSFTLPRPVANTLGPAELIVLPADNVVVSPRAEQSEGLRLEAALPSLPLPLRQQEPLVYRAGRERSRFVADTEIMSGVVTADIETQLHVSADDVVVQQRLSYDVAYEAVADVELLVPLSETPTVVMAGDQTLDLQDATVPGTEPPGFARVVAVLPSPRIGKFDLTVRQRRSLEDLKRPSQRQHNDESMNAAVGDPQSDDATDGNTSRNTGDTTPEGEDGANQEGAKLDGDNEDRVGKKGGEDDVGEEDIGEDDIGEDDIGEDDVGEDDVGEERIVVPLVMPAGAAIADSRVSVTTESGIQCDISKQPGWDRGQQSGNGGPRSGGGLDDANGVSGLLTATAAAGRAAGARQITLLLRRDAQLARDGVRVERAWVRTRLSDRSQDVFAAYRFTTLADRIELVMPPTWRQDGSPGGAGAVEARLDDVPTAVLEGDGVISIVVNPTPATEPSARADASSALEQPRVLELRFALPPLEAGASRFTLTAPTFSGSAWVRRLYWEVDVPRGRRVMGGADGFVGEYQWQRRGLVWSRISSLTSVDLANWVGVTQLATDAATTNRYLFSAINPPAEIAISAPRLSTIVLWASGASLVVGLLLIHVPQLRHPGVFWVCGVAVVASSVMHLELAVLIAQASSIGLVLVLLAAMLERRFAARRRGPTRTTGSSLVANKRTSRARFGPLLAGTSDSTQTSPVATSGSSHGSES